MDLKGEKALFEIGQRRKVIRGKDLSLDDRKVDLHLVEPTGVVRGVDEDGIGPLAAEAIGGSLAPMSGAEPDQPWWRNGDRAGRPNCDVTKGSGHRY
jgi:hypothetical protein